MIFCFDENVRHSDWLGSDIKRLDDLDYCLPTRNSHTKLQPMKSLVTYSCTRLSKMAGVVFTTKQYRFSPDLWWLFVVSDIKSTCKLHKWHIFIDILCLFAYTCLPRYSLLLEGMCTSFCQWKENHAYLVETRDVWFLLANACKLKLCFSCR